ncbi:MAG TPA: LytTR family DNA-binding domain-containing protein [Granulicella sp.]
MTLKAVIIDDEPLLRRSILRFLKPHPEVKVVAECGDGPSAIESIGRHTPDVLFLDVEMPGFNGFDVLSRLGTGVVPYTIFITAYAHYAVKAFEARAIDYLLKPFGQQRFDEALSRIVQRQIHPGNASADNCQQAAYLERIPIHHRGRIVFVRVSNVDWIEAEKNHVLLHMGQQVAVVRRTLSSLEQHLDPKQFIRIHRSTIINRSKVQEILPWVNGYHEIVLENGQKLRMSRYQQRSVRDLLGKEFAV